MIRASARRSAAAQRVLWRLLVQNGAHRVGWRIAAKRPLAGQHLVEHGPRGKDVAAMIDGGAANLLGGHVADRADDGPTRQ